MIERELNEEEILKIIPSIEDNIDWYGAISNAIISNGLE
jgi:hypothetical protein